MTEKEFELENAYIKMCDDSCHFKLTPHIRVLRDDGWKLEDSSVEYFMNSLEGPMRTLFKRFIHVDTYCNNPKRSPSFWRPQGFMCLADMLDYVEENGKDVDERNEVFKKLYEMISFDRYNSDESLMVLNYNGLTYIKIIDMYGLLNRAL